MLNEDAHLSDRELLLLADGELPPGRDARVRSHLTACCSCRTRKEEIERTLADFTLLHHDHIDSQAAPAAVARAQLKSRLAELAAAPQTRLWPSWPGYELAARIAACAAAVLLLAAMGIWGLQSQRLRSESEPAFDGLEHSPIPNRSLTPGATRPVKVSDVCPVPRDEGPHVVPVAVQQQIFQEYGMANAKPNDYELDYLITPELGGSDDPRNLWPEPHSSTEWNSYVKDALEDRLHQLVCSGNLDLTTAQHDIATNWIAAYKKYFHTEAPSSVFSDLTFNLHQKPSS